MTASFTKAGNLHQLMRRLSQMEPRKFRVDDANLEVWVNSPIGWLGEFVSYTFKENLNWFALQASIYEWIKQDGAIAEMESVPCEGWWARIITTNFEVKTQHEDQTLALVMAYEQYLGLKRSAHEDYLSQYPPSLTIS